MPLTTWVYCYFCFKRIEKENAIKKEAAYFCTWKCCESFFKKLENEIEKDPA